MPQLAASPYTGSPRLKVSDGLFVTRRLNLHLVVDGIEEGMDIPAAQVLGEACSDVLEQHEVGQRGKERGDNGD